ncbi:MAG TPA: Na+/H+ antiporter subunit E [Epsilonproteobacteria bacterium]|nr:Na+/H+ antiporter subunit E [Campylobacterota bacterium]
MKTTILPHPILSVSLLVAWLLLNNTLSLGHIVLGGILAILIPWFTASFWPNKVCAKNPLVFFKFCIVVLYDIIIANITVARLVIGSNDALRPSFFRLPLDIKHPLGISVLASTISLTPGTVSCDLSDDGACLTIHALDIDDIQKEIDSIKQRYEKPLMEVFQLC